MRREGVLTSQSSPPHGEASIALLELIEAAAVMNAVLESGERYGPAIPGWRSRMREIRDWARRQREEITDFAEGYD